MPTYSWDAIKSLAAPPPGLADFWLTVATPNQDGRIEVFVLGADGAVWHIWQLSPNSTSWSDWFSFGAPPGGGQLLIGGPMYVVQNADGRLELFASDGVSVWHIWQVAPNANWTSNWISFPLPASAAGVASPVKAFLDSGGCIQLITQPGETGEIFSRGQTTPNGSWASDWVSLGSPPPDCQFYVIAPLGRSLFDRVYATGGNIYSTSSQPVYVSQKSNFVEGSQAWSGWVLAPWTTPQNVLGVYISFAAENQDRRIEMFAINDYEYALWHTWQDDKNTWTGFWDNLGRPPDSPGDRGALSFGVALDALGRLTVARSQYVTDHGIYTIAQTAANNGWGEWQLVANAPVSSLQLVRQSNGLLMIVALNENEVMYIPQVEH